MSEMNAKIVAVIERLGATEMAAEIITDIVARGLGRMGGRPKKAPEEPVTPPPKPVTEPGKPVLKLAEPVSKPSSRVSGSPDLISSPDSPEISKPDQRDSHSDERRPTRALAVTKPVGAFTAALEQFKAAYYARYHVEYAPTASDRNQLGRLISDKTPDQLAALPACFAAYLNDHDPFIAQTQRHNLTWFCTKGNGFNKYRSHAPVLTAKEARTAAAGQQWLEMQEGADAAER